MFYSIVVSHSNSVRVKIEILIVISGSAGIPSVFLFLPLFGGLECFYSSACFEINFYLLQSLRLVSGEVTRYFFVPVVCDFLSTFDSDNCSSELA